MPTYSIASASYDGRVRVYDIRMGRTLVDVLAHPVTSVRCSSDGNALLASTTDGRIRMLDRSDGKLLKAFGGDDASPIQGNSTAIYRKSELRIRSVFAKADAIVLSGSEANDSGNGNGATQASVFAWDVLSGEVVACVPAGPGVKAVSAVSWNEKGGCWAGGCSDGMSQLWQFLISFVQPSPPLVTFGGYLSYLVLVFKLCTVPVFLTAWRIARG